MLKNQAIFQGVLLYSSIFLTLKTQQLKAFSELLKLCKTVHPPIDQISCSALHVWKGNSGKCSSYVKTALHAWSSGPSSHLTGWFLWGSPWSWSLLLSAGWLTGRWYGCSSSGPDWTAKASADWWDVKTCQWCPAPPAAGPPRSVTCSGYPVDLSGSHIKKVTNRFLCFVISSTDIAFTHFIHRLTWSVVCGGREEVPHLCVFESLHPLDIQGAQQRAAGAAERRYSSPRTPR